MATAPSDIGRTIQRPEPTWAMMGGAIPANRLTSKQATDVWKAPPANSGGSSMANSTTIPRESMSIDSTATGSRSVAIHCITSSPKPPVKRPITVSITPSPRTLRIEAQAAAALPADLGGLEGVIHSLLSSALEKIVDRMYRTSLQSDDQSGRPLAIAE